MEKTNWESRFDRLLAECIFGDGDDTKLKVFISGLIQQAEKEEKESIEKKNTNVAKMCSELKLFAYEVVPKGQIWINKDDYIKSDRIKL